MDPFVELANRTTGPVEQTVSFAEVNLQFNLTGGKSWHRLAPFVGAAVGLTFPSGTPAGHQRVQVRPEDSTSRPTSGTRIFLTDRLHLRARGPGDVLEAQVPDRLPEEPAHEPGTPDNSNAVITDGRGREWTATPWLQVGLGYSFSP